MALLIILFDHYLLGFFPIKTFQTSLIKLFKILLLKMMIEVGSWIVFSIFWWKYVLQVLEKIFNIFITNHIKYSLLWKYTFKVESNYLFMQFMTNTYEMSLVSGIVVELYIALQTIWLQGKDRKKEELSWKAGLIDEFLCYKKMFINHVTIL